MGDAFYQALDGTRFSSTEHTTGPWSSDAQHFGPPSALLTRALEQVPATFDSLLARVTVEILGPVPVTEVQLTAGLERPGRSVELLSATMTVAGRTVATARAWRIARSDSASVAGGAEDPLPPPEVGRPLEIAGGWGSGYLDAMEWRALRGSFEQRGPATMWVRQRVPLIEGEHPSPLQRLLMVADSGNGVSARLDPRQWHFINPELSVHIHRMPTGDWIGLDAATVIGDGGVGVATSVMHDARGPVARGAQALLVRHR